MSLYESQKKLIKHRMVEGWAYELVGTQAWRVDTGHHRFKLIRQEKPNGSDALQEILHEKGIRIPKLFKIVNDVHGYYFNYEWIDGKTFRELITAREIQPEHYYKLGEFVAKVNNEGMGFINYLPKNIVLSNEGEVFVCDLEKLILTPFPENAIVRYVLTEDLVDSKAQTFDLRTAFLEGYRKHRNLMLYDVLVKQLKVIYNSDEPPQIDPSRFSENPKYVPVSSGSKVLDLRFGKGYKAFKEAIAGAEYVYACDIHHTRSDKELFKSSDYGKLLAYVHGFDGRDLHYKWIEINSQHFIDHLRASHRRWDLVFMNGICDWIAPEFGKALNEYLKQTAKRIEL